LVPAPPFATVAGIAWWAASRAPGPMEDQMSDSDTKGSGLSLLDTALVVGAVIVGIFVVLWLVHAVVGLVLFFFKLAILVVIVAVIVRVVHRLSRSSD